MFLMPSAWAYEKGFPAEARILGFWVGVVPVISGTSVDTVYSFSPRYGLEEPVSVAQCYASIFSSTARLERPEYRSRSGTGLIGQDFGDPRACLRRCTTG